jgi:hypothetical protein
MTAALQKKLVNLIVKQENLNEKKQNIKESINDKKVILGEQKVATREATKVENKTKSSLDKDLQRKVKTDASIKAVKETIKDVQQTIKTKQQDKKVTKAPTILLGSLKL